MIIKKLREVSCRGDITGNVYNDLTVVYRAGSRIRINDGIVRGCGSLWFCKCSCGKTRIVDKSHLISGFINSCGCKKSINISKQKKKYFLSNNIKKPIKGYYDRSALIKNITGETYGDLTVLKLVGSKIRLVDGKYRGCGSLWLCKCSCGKEKVVTGTYLKQYKAKSNCSCGCKTNFHRIKGAIKRGYSLGVASKRSLYGAYKHNANKFGRIWDLTMNEFVGITSNDCYYCGKPPSQKVGGKNNRGEYTYNGIDRKNNSLGYIKNNVVPCCKVCNQMKHAFSYDLFITKVKEIFYKNMCFTNDTCEYYI